MELISTFQYKRRRYVTFQPNNSVCISKNIPRDFDLSLIILIQFSPRASSPQGLS